VSAEEADKIAAFLTQLNVPLQPYQKKIVDDAAFRFLDDFDSKLYPGEPMIPQHLRGQVGDPLDDDRIYDPKTQQPIEDGRHRSFDEQQRLFRMRWANPSRFHDEVRTPFAGGTPRAQEGEDLGKKNPHAIDVEAVDLGEIHYSRGDGNQTSSS